MEKNTKHERGTDSIIYIVRLDKCLDEGWKRIPNMKEGQIYSIDLAM